TFNELHWYRVKLKKELAVEQRSIENQLPIRFYRCLWVALVFFPQLLHAQLTPEQKQLEIASFEKVWTTVRDKHWDKNPGGLDWQAIHEEYRPRIDKATTAEQTRAI